MLPPFLPPKSLPRRPNTCALKLSQILHAKTYARIKLKKPPSTVDGVTISGLSFKDEEQLPCKKNTHLIAHGGGFQRVLDAAIRPPPLTGMPAPRPEQPPSLRVVLHRRLATVPDELGRRCGDTETHVYEGRFRKHLQKGACTTSAYTSNHRSYSVTLAPREILTVRQKAAQMKRGGKALHRNRRRFSYLIIPLDEHVSILALDWSIANCHHRIHALFTITAERYTYSWCMGIRG